MQFRLMLDREQIDRCRKMARDLAVHLERYASRHTSLAIEDATLRALGVQGDYKGRALSAVVLERLGRDRLREGAAYWLGAVMVARNTTPTLAAKHIAKEGFPDRSGEKRPHGDIRRLARAALAPWIKTLDEARAKRQTGAAPQRWGAEWQLMALLHTGHAEDDLKQVRALGAQAGIGSVIVRPPLAGATADLVGRGRGWRAKYDALDVITRLDHVIQELQRQHKRAIPVTWDGCTMAGPMMAVALAQSRLAGMAYDCLSLIAVHGVHWKRAIVDQAFVYRLLARAGVGVTVTSERWRGAVDGYAHGHELLMGQLLVEAMGERAGLPLEKMAPCHGLVIPRDAEHLPQYLIDEVAHAQLVRECFPQVPLRFAVPTAPPEETVTSVGIAALCGFPVGLVEWTAAAPAAAAAIARARQLLSDVGAELTFEHNGRIARRASMLVERMTRAMHQLQRHDLLRAEARPAGRGLFAFPDAGVGLDGVVPQHKYYWNPLQEWLTA